VSVVNQPLYVLHANKTTLSIKITALKVVSAHKALLNNMTIAPLLDALINARYYNLVINRLDSVYLNALIIMLNTNPKLCA
jgi:hypothetical protein